MRLPRRCGRVADVAYRPKAVPQADAPPSLHQPANPANTSQIMNATISQRRTPPPAPEGPTLPKQHPLRQPERARKRCGEAILTPSRHDPVGFWYLEVHRTYRIMKTGPFPASTMDGPGDVADRRRPALASRERQPPHTRARTFPKRHPTCNRRAQLLTKIYNRLTAWNAARTVTNDLPRRCGRVCGDAGHRETRARTG
jgi:hypothetical protein